MRMKLIPALLLLAWPLSAQEGVAEADCGAVLAETLASGIEHDRLPACAHPVIPGLGAAIRTAARETEPGKLAVLHGLSFSIRHPVLYEAGLALGQSATAEPASRVLGLAVALAQVNPTVSFDRLGAGPFQAPLSETCEEAAAWVHPRERWVDHGLADEAEQRLYALAGSLAENDAESLMIRRFARCVVLMLPDPNPPSAEIPPWPDEPPR